jgi:hypothetical protein
MPLTDEDKQSIAAMIAESNTALLAEMNKTVTGAMTSRDKKLVDSINKQIDARWEKEVEDALNDPEYVAELEAGNGAGDAERTQVDPKKTPEYIAQQRRLDALEQQVRTEQDARLAAVGKQRGDSLRTRVSELLTKHGLDPARVRHAIAWLVSEEKRVKYASDEADDLLFHDGDADLPLEDGIKGWMKSEDAKQFIPARGVQGSGGSRQQTRPVTRGNGIQPGEGGSALAQALSSGFDFSAGPVQKP